MKRIVRLGIYSIQKIKFFFNKLRLFFQYRKNTDLMNFVENRQGRLPKNIVKNLSRNLKVNNRYLPGRKIEFYVSSKMIHICVLYSSHRLLKNMTLQGTSSLEVTISDNSGMKENHSIVPDTVTRMLVEKTFSLDGNRNLISILLPPFAIINSILIDQQCDIKHSDKKRKKIIVYGSSITHGCAASRPSLSYVNLLSEMTGCDVLNFGFSESAKGETEVIQYIASLKPDIVILEYDHNSSVEELKNRHLNVYRTIRSFSECWIIFMSRFSGGLSITAEEEQERIYIISSTYHFALSQNDNKVAFIPGDIIMSQYKEDYFVDKVHPNDDGMMLIADTINNEIKYRGILK